MRKIRLRATLQIPGYGMIPKGTEFMVVKFNKRFVYVKVSERTTLRLARKRDCTVIY